MNKAQFIEKLNCYEPEEGSEERDVIKWLCHRVALKRAAKIESIDKPVEVFISRNRCFNACAQSLSDIDAICFNSSCHLFLRGAFRAVMSDPQVLPQITCSKEQTLLAYHGPPEGRTTDPSGWHLPALVDPLREDMANRLCQIGMQFLLSHEHAHIQNGHSDYLNKHIGVRAISERSEDVPIALSPITYYTLEFDADCEATNDVLGECLGVVAVNRSQVPMQWVCPENNEFGSIDDALFAAHLVLGVVHSFFISDFNSLSNAFSFTHPPAIVRAESNRLQISSVLHHRTIYKDLNSFKNAAKGAKLAFELAIRASNINSEKFSKYYDEHQDIIFPIMQLQEAEWERLRPFLDKYKRGGSLAPARPYEYEFSAAESV